MNTVSLRRTGKTGTRQLGKFSTPTPHDSGGTLQLQQLADQQLLIKALIDQLPDFVFVKDVHCRFLVANKAIAKAYGFENSEDLIGKTDFDLHPKDRAQKFYDFEQDVIKHGLALKDMQESFPDSAGVPRWYSTTKIPLRNRNDQIIGLLGVARDVTERTQMESLRLQQGWILEMIAKNAPLVEVLDRLVLLMESQLRGIRCSVLLADAEGRHLHHGAAPSLPEAYNRAVDGVPIGPKVGSCGTAAHRRESVIAADILSDPLWEDYRALATSAGLRSCWSTPILSHQGAVLGTFAMYSSEVRLPNAAEMHLIEASTRIAGIAIERQQSEDRIRFIAHHDAITGLPNRTVLEERLRRAIEEAERSQLSLSVAFVDLDGFKVVNDGLGHMAGDQLLKVLAARMAGCVRSSDCIIRLGGDEFVLLLLDGTKAQELTTAVLQRIRAAMSEPVQIEGRHLRITCSVGISVYPRDGRDVESLLKNADAAMYSAKGAGSDSVLFYSADMNAEVAERLFLQEELRDAVAGSQLHLVYQPQVDLRSGRIFAVEALARWDHPKLGTIPPTKFIPIAEESGLIVSLGDWVLRTACAQNKAWQDAGLDPIVMSVNVSARQFGDDGWTARVTETLRQTGMDPCFLEMELTESMLMHDLKRATATMQELKSQGIQLSIDDFGTGYSSLCALKRFPVSRLKIDASFVRDLAHDDNDKAIASAVISLGQNLGLRVIAEGVEAEEQLSFLRQNHCDEVQGYLFSKPLSPSDTEVLLRKQALGECCGPQTAPASAEPTGAEVP